MRLSKKKTALLQETILRLFTAPFDETLILRVARNIETLVGAQYFSLFCLLPQGIRAHPLFVSTSPQSYIPAYFSVMDKDFLLSALFVPSCREYILRRSNDYRKEENSPFIDLLQDLRPIADIAYYRLPRFPYFTGLWSFGRKGYAEQDAPFSGEELELMRFIVPFLNSALERSSRAPPTDEELAYLDSVGQLVGGGAKIRETFKELFGPDLLVPNRSQTDARLKAFKESFKRFVDAPLLPGNDMLALDSESGRHLFRFALLDYRSVFRAQAGIPYASVELVGARQGIAQIEELDMKRLSPRFGFTPRECQVVQGIFKGSANKTIAAELGVDESTVKRHTHNIYEKSGFRSRTELILGLGKKIN